jgi:DNA-binding SARP family transcriptional activator
MSYAGPLLLTKFTPPHPARQLARPALVARLGAAFEHRLTLVAAGTGYSKTTAVAALAATHPVLWYSLDESDRDPPRFLAYLIAACGAGLPALADAPRAQLAEAGHSSGPAAWESVLDRLINALASALPGPTVLVLDDYHLVAENPAIGSLIERLLTYGPANLHLILISRYPQIGLDLRRWRARGEVLEIGRADLAFSALEIARLFGEIYDYPLADMAVAMLAARTEGWPIALQAVRQGLRGAAPAAPALLAQGSASLGTLFDYLAGDVLAGLPPDLAAFLQETAVLRELTPGAVEAVTGDPAAPDQLARLRDMDLFIVAVGNGHYRYHHLFHDFLRDRLAADPSARAAQHRRAAAFFAAQGAGEEAIYHWVEAGEWAEAAAAIERAGEAALRHGWLDTVARWIDGLPPAVLAEYPLLLAYLGDVARLHSRFDDALGWYAQAEATWKARGDGAGVSRALRGQALVYLDTVRPAQAEHLLEEALRLSDGAPDSESRARLLELLAENKLNMGQPAAAEALQAQAHALREQRPGDDTLSVRVKLRTGQLDAAQQILESWAEVERQEVAHGQVHPPRAHRETPLLLALIHALRGAGGPAFTQAEAGLNVGARLASPFVSAVAHIRLGHAWQLRGGTPPDPAQALPDAVRCYEAGIALGDQLAVRRLRAEALWGLTRAYGFAGDLAAARRAAAEGGDIARAAGDLWMAALIDLALGGSLTLAGQTAEALPLLTGVLNAMRDCGDRLGQAAARLWLALATCPDAPSAAATHRAESLTLAEAHGYDFLWTAPSMLSPPDPRRLVPLLLAARAEGMGYAARLLAANGLAAVTIHPGYALRVQTLGAFRVWRGATELLPAAWQRDKARQVFQLLLTARNEWLTREAIADRLWPDLPPDAAQRDFKVALNALNRALEPARASDAPFAYVVREGSAYRLRAEADLWLDAATFEQGCRAGLAALDAGDTATGTATLETALASYTGDYLPEAAYDDWAATERERLRNLYLRAADRLAEALLGAHPARAAAVAEALLARDPCWESAYRLLMRAYSAAGNRPQALRAYARCQTALAAELGLPPDPATTRLYQSIMDL